jgi:hypothetical protein
MYTACSMTGKLEMHIELLFKDLMYRKYLGGIVLDKIKN